MQNSEYWKKRFEALEDDQYKKSQKYIEDMEKQFREAQKNITMDIEHWYQRLADNNEVSLAAARRLLEKNELEEFHWNVEQYIKAGEENAVDQRWMKQLENASAKVHIQRLEAMKLQMQQHAELLYTKYHNGVTDYLNNSYADRFYRTAYEIQKGTGIGSNLAVLDNRKIDKVLTTPWAADGKNFSDRIWTNKEKMVNELHRELTQSVIRGDDPQKAINNLARNLNTSKVNAGRLVMTETAAISSAAQKDCFAELDVEQFEVVATLDSHTSDICQEMDGKHFKMSEWEVGVTAPPFHVWCRSTTVPYFEDDFGVPGERAARGEDGKTYYVPADMTYKEWEKKFVKKEDKTTDYIIRAHTQGQNITNERKVVNDVISKMPKKVQDALNNGTIIDVGKNGASQYDYVHDILYVAKGADENAVIHEIGHIVENKMLDEAKAENVKMKIIGDVDIWSLTTSTYYDNENNAVEVVILECDKLVSEYQGRVYCDTIWDAFDENGNFRSDLLWEMYSEPFRLYCESPNELKEKCPDMYELIMEAVE